MELGKRKTSTKRGVLRGRGGRVFWKRDVLSSEHSGEGKLKRFRNESTEIPHHPKTREVKRRGFSSFAGRGLTSKRGM